MVASGQDLPGQAKGPLAEQRVRQQLFANGFAPCSWIKTEHPKKLGFLVRTNRAVLPIEAKGGTSLRAPNLKAMAKRLGFSGVLRLSKISCR